MKTEKICSRKFDSKKIIWYIQSVDKEQQKETEKEGKN